MRNMRRSRCRGELIAFAVSASSDQGTRVSLLIEQRVLTPEQTAALSRYRARWTAIRRSTEAADREAAKKGVRLAYVAAGIKPPARFIWCESPIALSRGAHQASRTDG